MLKFIIFLFLLKISKSIDITKCMKCRFLIKDKNNIYQSRCQYYSKYNKTYPQFIGDLSFDYDEKNFISVQEAVNDETKCGYERKNYKYYPF